MRRFKNKRFYSSNKDFENFKRALKQTPCPHCMSVEYLILHGYLYGYAGTIGSKRIIRGRRVFCSNRHRRGGCGRTFSLSLKNIIRNFIINADILWSFLNNILNGMNTINAFKSTRAPFSQTTAYRLFQKVHLIQNKIRTLLTQKRPPSPSAQYNKKSITETTAHLKAAFNHHTNPIAAFQEHFQVSFL